MYGIGALHSTLLKPTVKLNDYKHKGTANLIIRPLTVPFCTTYNFSSISQHLQLFRVFQASQPVMERRKKSFAN